MKLYKSFVMMLHDVTDPGWLEKILLHLGKYYQFVRSEEIESFYENPYKRNICHLTADDGNISFYENVFPVLKKHKIPASLYVSPKVIDTGELFWFQKVNQMDNKNLSQIFVERFNLNHEDIKKFNPKEIFKLLPYSEIVSITRYYEENWPLNSKRQSITEKQLQEMVDSGWVEPGAHTLNHPILANENNHVAEHEISQSISDLGNMLNTRIQLFAYPNGTPGKDFGKREIDILKKNRIELAFSTRVDHLSDKDTPYDMPRIGLTYGSMNFVRNKIILGKKWSILKNIKRKLTGNHRDLLYKKLYNQLNPSS